jgi:hypothetical protein
VTDQAEPRKAAHIAEFFPRQPNEVNPSSRGGFRLQGQSFGQKVTDISDNQRSRSEVSGSCRSSKGDRAKMASARPPRSSTASASSSPAPGTSPGPLWELKGVANCLYLFFALVLEYLPTSEGCQRGQAFRKPGAAPGTGYATAGEALALTGPALAQLDLDSRYFDAGGKFWDEVAQPNCISLSQCLDLIGGATVPVENEDVLRAAMEIRAAPAHPGAPQGSEQSAHRR